MNNKNKRLVFGIDANQVTVKKLLSKDFLELSMKAISSANPNRNGSWFTPESLEKALPTFKNKPILGYFENGDFVSHNGSWRKDEETEMNYWDTLGKQGERILGLIRSEDDVSIVEEGGLHWIVLTCALWVQYSYKQVKRLLKDAIKAQRSGESTKSISVEIDITDYEIMDNGIMKIKDFNLIGITILGSRDGRIVQPGIEGADLSVVEMMDRDVFTMQRQALRMAYAKLEEPDANKHKEEFLMENTPITEVVETPAVMEEIVLENTSTEITSDGSSNFEQVLDTPEDEVVVVENEVVENEQTPITAVLESTEVETEVEPAPEIQIEEGSLAPSETTEPETFCADCEETVPEPNPIHDIASLIEHLTWNIERYDETIEFYKKHEEIEGKDYILLVLSRLKEQALVSVTELGALLGKIVTGLTEEDFMYEQSLSEHSDLKTLYDIYSVSKKENEDLKIKVAKFENEAMLNEAKRLTSHCNINKDVVTAIYDKCSQGHYASIEGLKAEIALAAFDANFKVEETSFSAPVIETPTVPSVGSAEKPTQRSSWEVLTDYGKK